MKGLLFIVGAVVGVLLVRAFFLEPVQIMGWNIFWRALSEGQMMKLDVVFGSETFIKCALGFLMGGILGASLGSFIDKKNAASIKEDKA